MSSRKRKIAVLATVFSLALFTLVYGFAFPSSALAWDNCPKGLVNDPYPGLCRRYVDTNGDGICDLSQSEPVAATTTTTTKPPETTTTGLAVTTTTSGEPPTGNCPLGPCAGCGACLSGGIGAAVATVDNSSDASSASLAAAGGGAAVLVSTAADATTSTTTPSGGATADSGTAATGAADASTSAANAGAATLPAAENASASVGVVTEATSGAAGFLTHYLVSPIALGFLLIYGASFYLYRKKRIRIATHRKIWNMLLLGTFLITGIFGTILAIQLDYAPRYIWPVNLLFWHVEAGIVMTFISLFHMAWHFKYYKGIVRNAREKWRVIRATEKEFEVDDRRLVLEAREARRAEREGRRAERQSGQAPRAERDAVRIRRERWTPEGEA
jgi:hypothetical protein